MSGSAGRPGPVNTVSNNTNGQTIGDLERAAAQSKAMNTALIELRHKLFQAMGIVRMAAFTIQEPGYAKAETDAWTSLDGAYDLLCRVADRLASTETVLLGEVPRGEY